MQYLRIFLGSKQVYPTLSREWSHTLDLVPSQPWLFSPQMQLGPASFWWDLGRQSTVATTSLRNSSAVGCSPLDTMVSTFEAVFVTFQNCTLAWHSWFLLASWVHEYFLNLGLTTGHSALNGQTSLFRQSSTRSSRHPDLSGQCRLHPLGSVWVCLLQGSLSYAAGSVFPKPGNWLSVIPKCHSIVNPVVIRMDNSVPPCCLCSREGNIYAPRCWECWPLPALSWALLRRLTAAEQLPPPRSALPQSKQHGNMIRSDGQRLCKILRISSPVKGTTVLLCRNEPPENLHSLLLEPVHPAWWGTG